MLGELISRIAKINLQFILCKRIWRKIGYAIFHSRVVNPFRDKTVYRNKIFFLRNLIVVYIAAH